uniref:Uncharacterized protein n=1 Tax=viral metagenome TaxID=1070528 RepID=A0A6C0JHA6_9ZZZZ
MSTSNFLEKDNIELMWEVLTDEPLIKQLCNSEIKLKNIMHIFESNLRDFFVTEKNNCNNLVELNKKYILLIINYIIKTHQNQYANTAQGSGTTNQYKKIRIHEEEPIKQSITYEDIHNDRMTIFEKELNQKQEEFTSAMALQVPPVPNFSDNLDQPISEIEVEIKRIQEQRNYDIEIINNTNKNGNAYIDENWLKPQETSIKNEKLIKISATSNSGSNSTNSTSITNTNRHISWEDEQQNKSEEQEALNIFGKLKKITSTDNSVPNYQIQIDDLKKEISTLNEKLDIFLQKYK